MKRILLATVIFVTAVGTLLKLRSANHENERELAVVEESIAQCQAKIDRQKNQHIQQSDRLRELKRELRSSQPIAADREWTAIIEQGGSAKISENAREKLFEELGLDWNASPEFLIVSKESLHNIGLSAVEKNKLTGAICGALDISGEERSALNAVLTEIDVNQKAWVLANAQREDPSGDILAHYSIPANPGLGQSFSNALASAATSALGDDRAVFFMDYVQSSMHQSAVLEGSESTLKIRRYMSGGKPQLSIELKSQNGSMSCGITKYQPVPAPFRPLFPGGWKELAQREGFELPPDFK